MRDTLLWDQISSNGYFDDVYGVRSSNGGVRWSTTHSAGLTYDRSASGRLRYVRAPAVGYPLYDRSQANSIRAYGGLGVELIVEARSNSTGNPPRFWLQRSLTFPLSLPALFFALLPAVYLRRRHRIVRRRAGGLCPTCGYDLRASSGRCPECGL